MCPNDTQNASFGPEYVFFINLLCYFINLWFFYPTLITLTPYAHLYNPQPTCLFPPCQQPNKYVIYFNLTYYFINSSYMTYMTHHNDTMMQHHQHDTTPTDERMMQQGWSLNSMSFGPQGMFLPKLMCLFIHMYYFF